MGGTGKDGPEGTKDRSPLSSSDGPPPPGGAPPSAPASASAPPDSNTDPDRPAPAPGHSLSTPRPSRREPGPVFVCDASAEAERLMTSLRNRGYSAVDVPLGMLPGRVRYELPSLVVCDADAHEALQRIKEMRESAPEEVLLLFVGHDDGALAHEAEMKELATATLVRPLNLTATVDLIQSIVGTPPDKGEKSPRHPRRKRPALIVASARKPYRSDVVGTDRPLSSSRPSELRPHSAPPSQYSLPPVSESLPPLSDSNPPGSASSVPPSSGESKLSAETRSLLDEGRRRLAGHPLQPGAPQRSAHDQDHSSPAEALLEALKEPLDPADGSEESRRAEQDIPDSRGESTGLEGAGVEGALPSEPPPEPEEEAPRPDPEPPSSGPKTTIPPGVVVAGRKASGMPEDEPEDRASSAEPQRSSQPTWSLTSPGPQRSFRSDDLTATSERVGGPIPNRRSESTGPSSDTATLAPPRRSDTQRPGSSDAVEADDQTNPGGRLPTQRPGSGGALDSLRGILPRAPSRAPPPLDDLSDLLTGGADDPFEPLRTPAPPTLSTFRNPPRGNRTSLDLDSGAPEEPTATEDRTDPVGAIGQAIRERRTGSLAQEDGGGVRRLVVREGDILTATSSREDETLTRYLAERGDISAETASALSPIPHFGRHAGAALIARGVLRQEDLWPVLRAHAEWLLGRILLSGAPVVWEDKAPIRVSEEPAVFGGAAGAEIFLDLIRRVIDARMAHRMLGGGTRRLGRGVNEALLGESALEPSLERRALSAAGSDLNLILEREPDLLPILLALTELGVLSTGASPARRRPAEARGTVEARSEEMDERAFADRINARRALVDQGDYFTLLGISRTATGPEVDRAREELHRELSPAKLTPRTAHLRSDIELILQMVDEAHLVLRDDVMRSRYRRALEDSPR